MSIAGLCRPSPGKTTFNLFSSCLPRRKRVRLKIALSYSPAMRLPDQMTVRDDRASFLSIHLETSARGDSGADGV